MKKSGVRFWALLLTAVLLVTGIPALPARADEPEPEKPVKITAAAVLNLNRPRDGKKPDYEAETASELYYLCSEYSAPAITWMDMDANREMKETDVFEAGTYYRVYIRLKISDVTEAVFTETTVASVNGDGAVVDGWNKEHLNFHADYICPAAPSGNEIVKVSVCVPAPVAGEGACHYLTDSEANGRYEEDGIKWIDRETGLDASNDHFLAGRIYGVQIRLNVKDGYTFVVDEQGKAEPAALINGMSAKLVEGTAYSILIEADFPPAQEPATGIEIDGVNKEYEYTGFAIRPDPEVYDNGKRLVKGVDYTLKYSNNLKPYTTKLSTVTVKFKGNRSGEEKEYFEIKKAEMSDAAAAAGKYSAEPVYGTVKDGKRQELKPVLWHGDKELKLNKDYTLEYPDTAEGAYAQPGSWTVRAVGTGNYTGSYELQEILIDAGSTGMKDLAESVAGVNSMPVDILDDPKEVSVSFPGEDYLKEGVDYTLRYVGLGRVGTVSCIITAIPGNGKCYGSTVVKYKITKGNFANYPKDVLVIGTGDTTYVKGGVRPEVTVILNGVVLKEGEDYKLSYGANKDASKPGTVKVSGKGAYTGTRTEEFAITPGQLEHLTLCVGDADAKGGAGKVKYTLTDRNGKALKKNTDFTESITDNGDGSATLVLTAKGNNYSGTVSAGFKLRPETKDIKKAKVKLLSADGMEKKDFEYSGKAVCPGVKLVLGGKNGAQLIPGTDYEVLAYANNLESGTALIMIAGRGDYTGLMTYRFRIRPAKVFVK